MSSLLMVDHAALFRVLEGTCVRRWGWTIHSAATADEMLQKSLALSPDLVLLFAGLPGWDAPACVRALRAGPPDAAPRALLVGSASELEACAGAGADATLAWPATPEALEAMVAALTREAPRRGRRRATAVPARVAGGSTTVRGRLRDIGPGGAFVSLPRAVPLQGPVAIALRLPLSDGTLEVSARGIVVRQVEATDDSHQLGGVAIRFTDVDAASRQALDRFVLELDPDEAARPAAGRADA